LLRIGCGFRTCQERLGLRTGGEAGLILQLLRLRCRFLYGRGRRLRTRRQRQTIALQPALDDREIVVRRCGLRFERRRQWHRAGDIERARIERRELREIRIGN
jgi:hypothetical protein